MKIKLDTKFKALGKELMDRMGQGEEAQDVPYTMKNMLLAYYTADKPKGESPEQRLERGRMAQKVHEAKKHIELTMKQFVDFRDWVKENVTHPLLYTAITEVLDKLEGN